MTAIESFDVVIIGGGPAGISCSIELKENLIRHALLERTQELGGQLPQIVDRIKNFAGVPFENGTALQNTIVRTANQLNLPFRLNDEVIAVNLRQKTIKTRHSSLIANAIVIATGTRLRKLTVAKGAHLSAQVIYRLEGKETEFKGRSAIVIGGGDGALKEALWLAKNGGSAYLICRSDKLKARPDLIDKAKKSTKIEILMQTEVCKLLGESDIQAVEVRNSQTDQRRQIPISLVVAKLGQTANIELFEGQLEMSENGSIKTNKSTETSIKGVFAIGDVSSSSYWRISTAVGEGATAANAVTNYLSLSS